jgi:RNA polymerase sigma-70 factor, ECF subfamily
VGDDDIRAALRRGDTDTAFLLLERHHGPAIYSRCCRILKNPTAAEDVMQQALMAAFKHRSQLLEVTQIRGWLISIATRKCLDALRSSKRADRLHDSLRDADADAGNSEDLLKKLGTTEDGRAIEECLRALEPELAAAVLMRHHDDMSWEQISEAIGVPVDTIRMRVRRALPSLCKCLESKGVKL